MLGDFLDMDLPRFRAVRSPEAFWSLVRDLTARVLSNLGRGRRVILIAPPVLPFRPSQVGHMHDQIELLLGGVGEGGMRLREGSVPIRPGAVTLIPRGIPHREFISDPRQPYANVVLNAGAIAFGGHTRITVAEETNLHYRARFADKRAARSYRYLMDATAAIAQGASARDHLVRGLVQAGLALMQDAIAGLAPYEVADLLVHVAQIYVETHLCVPELSVAEVARQLGYSPDYLSHRFHSVTGMRLSAFITEQRMLLATRLLEEDAFNISEVARACGFQDPAYFSRVFRARFGQPPRAWRAAQSAAAG